MIFKNVIVNGIEQYIKEKNIDKKQICSSKVKDILRKICGKIGYDTIFEPSHINDYNNVIQYFADKYKFNFRKKKLQNLNSKFVYRCISKEKIKLGSINGIEVFINPSETIIIYDKEGKFIRFVCNGLKFKMDKIKWRQRIKANEFVFIEEIKTKEFVI